MLRLFLVRHGETDWNQQMRFQGQTDVALNARGIEQAEAIAHRLHNQPIQAIYSSDLRRSLQTAQIIARYHNLYPIPDADLRELCYGVWEGMSRDEILASEWAELFEKYLQDSLRYRPPGAEYPEQILERSRRVLQRIRHEHRAGTVCIVGHGGSLRALVCVALSAPLETFRHIRLDNASLSAIECRDDWTWVSLINDTCHLTQERVQPVI
ncbi:MAG: histidine phosphatase family protein [Armatimonadota bacterium]|nr:histidine phosphatase family protein [bacterium]MDW8321507.1 histidine phosphatase family protein [Armatimonadota bacterium]